MHEPPVHEVPDLSERLRVPGGGGGGALPVGPESESCLLPRALLCSSALRGVSHMRGFLKPSLRRRPTDAQTAYGKLARGRRAKLAKTAQTTLVKADQWARGDAVPASVSGALEQALKALAAKAKPAKKEKPQQAPAKPPAGKPAAPAPEADAAKSD